MDDDRRCTATSKRSGNRCKRAAIRGGNVCSIHGGKARQVRQAAEHRAAKMEAHAQAERMVARAGTGADPIEHLVDSLYRASALVEVWGRMVADLDASTPDGTLRGDLTYDRMEDDLAARTRDRLIALDRSGMAKVHPYVVEYHQALERRAKFAKLALDAGVAERQVRIAEEQARMVAEVIRAAVDEAGLDEQSKTKVVRAAAGRLRLIEGGQAA